VASSRLIALLGLLAVAGYQNREKLGEMLGRVTNRTSADPGSVPGSGQGSGLGGLLGNLGGLFSGGAAGGLSGMLADLLNGFNKVGDGETAQSWVSTGPNRELGANQIEAALGDDTIEQLVQQTGLSREELLQRLKTVLPIAVDKLTPEGRLPTEDEAKRWATS
jgi:uncharacterized protein YidB (DUF937 family)